MKDRPEYDDMHVALHEAFGAEVADLAVSATPVGAVMKGGSALRARRRLAAVSGVAALAVLPVAVVAIFSGGSRPVDSAGESHGTGGDRSTTTSPERFTVPTALLPSPTVTLPPQGRRLDSTAPNPRDDYTVVAGGTFGGQHWRLVRDVFVIPGGVTSVPGAKNHLPKSQRGTAGTSTCDYIGLQWGDRPPGTLPDFGAVGGCDPVPRGDVERIAGLLMSASQTMPSSELPMTSFVGRVDSSKITSVTVTVGARTTSRQPVYTVAGEAGGYYVVFVSPLTFQDERSVFITGYDASGQVVAQANVSIQQPVAH
jgi:hypothetical protein